MPTIMQEITVYHNKNCSKSCAALDFLKEKGVTPTVVEYLKHPPTRPELETLIKKLGIAPHQLVRKGEKIYKELYKDKQLSEEEWIDALLLHPVLIERPILIKGDHAVIARPTEKIDELL